MAGNWSKPAHNATTGTAPESPDDSVSMDSTVSTVQMNPQDFHGSTVAEPNNSPGELIREENLDLDVMVTDRLTHKPPNKYKFRKSIGRGGMKMVLQMRDMDSTRDVAMAILPDAAIRPKRDILRFVQEARLTASLEHPNIVPVHEIGVDSNGAPYFTMKLIHGETLASVLTKLADHDPDYVESYDIYRLLHIFLKICSGVAFAHAKGVIHLDLKPDNIQIGNFGEVLIMDWGLARLLQESELNRENDEETIPMDDLRGHTIDGVMKGTPGYMAPEQAAGKNSEKDRRTDIYALGAILYAILTLKNPIASLGIPNMIRDTAEGRIIPPRDRVPEREIPQALEAVVMKAMALSPDDRYQTVQDLRDEVRAFIGGYATQAENASVFKKTVLFVQRHALIFFAFFIIFFLLSAFSIYAIQEHYRKIPVWDQIFAVSFHPDMAVPENVSILHFSDWASGEPANAQGSAPGKDLPALMQFGSSGLIINPDDWVCIENVAEDTMKLEMEIVPSGKDAALELRLVETKPDHDPDHAKGLRLSFGEGISRRTAIWRSSKNRSKPICMTACAPGFIPGRRNTVTLILQNGEVSVFLNQKEGKPPLIRASFHPEYHCRTVLLRTRESGVQISRIVSSFRTIPEKPSPLLAGDSLAEVCKYDLAISQYLRIADSPSLQKVADEALLKAYQTAAWMPVPYPQKRKYLLDVKSKIAGRNTFSREMEIRRIDACLLWENGHYKSALKLIDRIMTESPGDRVVLSILEFRKERIPQKYAERLLQHIGTLKDVTALDLSGLGVPSLKPISNLPLSYLDCSGNRLSGLEGVEKMPLQFLLADGNQIQSLEPLSRNKTLRFVSLRNNPVQASGFRDSVRVIADDCDATAEKE